MPVESTSGSSDILELCLQAIERGEATPEQCVAQYPGVEGLGEMLHAAMATWSVPRPVMSLAAKAALEQQLVARMNAARALRPQPVRVRRTQRWLRLPLTLAAMLVLLLSSGIGLAHAAENSLPGDVLYGMKRASEQVSLLLADPPSRPAVLTHIARVRLAEVTKLVELGRSVDQSVLSDTVESLSVAAAAQPDAEKRAALFEQGQHAVELVSTSGNTNQANSLAAALKGIATPTNTEQPGHAPTETPTPTLTPTFTPSPTPTLTPTPTDDTKFDPTRRGPRRTLPPRPTKDNKGKGNDNSGDKSGKGSGN